MSLWAGGIDVRMGMGGRSPWRIPPGRGSGFTLIVVGLIIMLLSMPFYVYAAVFGGLIAYFGYTLLGR